MATAPDPSSTKRIEDILTCSICKETFDEPRRLPCFHSFCSKCLAIYVDVERKKVKSKNKADNVFNCPTCRTQFKLRRGQNVEQLKSSHFINNMLELLPLLQREALQKVQCESCEEKHPASCRCIECERYLCSKCLETHNNWLDFKNHVVLTLEELAKPENHSKAKCKPRCQKQGHGNKPHEFYCISCKQLACINCALLEHRKPGHNYKPVEIVAQKRKDELMKTSVILQGKFNIGEKFLVNIKQAFQNLQESSKNAKDAALQQRNEILEKFTRKLDKKTAALIADVERKHDNVNQDLVKQRDSTEDFLKRVDGSLEFVKNIIEKGSNEEILSIGNGIEMNTNNVEKDCPKSMRPIHDGYIKYLPVKSSRTVVDGINLNNFGNVVDSPVQLLYESSTILDGDSNLADQLIEWVDKEFGWQLCYKASKDGWQASDFHRKCDHVGPTVTLVKCGSNVFGGYTTDLIVDWI